MKTRHSNAFISCCMLVLFHATVKAQDAEVVAGLLLKNNTLTTIEHALVYNKRTLATTQTNALGKFEMLTAKGDTLEISREGYSSKAIRVTGFQEITIYLEPAIVLNEVIITGQRNKPNVEEITADYRRANSIYYHGKPPLTLLSPFGGKPITFFRELFSKSGKRVRRFDRLMAQESENNEIDARFNSRVIQRITPLKEAEIDAFKTLYRPDFDDLKQWSDYDLFEYIKESFKKFKSIK